MENYKWNSNKQYTSKSVLEEVEIEEEEDDEDEDDLRLQQRLYSNPLKGLLWTDIKEIIKAKGQILF